MLQPPRGSSDLGRTPGCFLEQGSPFSCFRSQHERPTTLCPSSLLVFLAGLDEVMQEPSLPFILPATRGSSGSAGVTVWKVTHARRQETGGLRLMWEARLAEKSDPYFYSHLSS